LPAGVVKRAQEILRNLERTEFDREGRPRLAHSDAEAPSGSAQLTLFGREEDAIIEDLRRIQPDSLTPLDALNLLADMKRRLG
jgi:DNA mismatch repair protein MutS